jgi:hypothetical protein
VKAHTVGCPFSDVVIVITVVSGKGAKYVRFFCNDHTVVTPSMVTVCGNVVGIIVSMTRGRVGGSEDEAGWVSAVFQLVNVFG